MSLYTSKQMNEVILSMYSSYIQIQIACFKSGVRVLYVVFLQTFDTWSRSDSGTDSAVLQPKCHQPVFFVDYQKIFHQYIDFVMSTCHRRKMEDQIWLDLLFQSSTLSGRTCNSEAVDQCVNVVFLSIWAKKKTKFCADQTATKGWRERETRWNHSSVLHLPSWTGVIRRFTGFTFSDPHSWDVWGELITISQGSLVNTHYRMALK